MSTKGAKSNEVLTKKGPLCYGRNEGRHSGWGRRPPSTEYRRYRAAYDPDIVVNPSCLSFSTWRVCSRPALLDPLPPAYGVHALTGRGEPENLAASHETESPKSVTPLHESQVTN
jgi:hypothetical protein